MLSESEQAVDKFIKEKGLDKINNLIHEEADVNRTSTLLWSLSNISASDEDQIYKMLKHS